MKTLVVAVAACAALPCLAAEIPASLEPVVVIGTRSEQEQNRLPAAVTVITRADIARSGARHVVDVLRTAAGLQVSDLYGDGSRATVDARGFGDAAHSSTLVLVDGRRLNNTDIAPPDLNSIALDDVERIEIIHGSAGTLYGDQAVGGVVNIVLREPGACAADAGAHVGSYRAYGARAAVEQRWRLLSARLAAEDRHGENYREHNALDWKDIVARVGYDDGGTRLSVEGSYVFEDLETPGPLFASEYAQDRRQSTAAFREDFSDTNTGFIRVRWREALGSGWALDTDLDHRRSFGDFRLSFASGTAPPGTQVRELRAMHPKLTGALPTQWGEALLTVGADGQLDDYVLRSVFGVQANQQQQGDLYVQATQPLPARLEVTAGARYSEVKNEPSDGFTFTTPAKYRDRQPAAELGLAWRTGALRLFARYDRNFRYAKVDEFTSACAAPDTMALDTQVGNSYEAGADLELHGLVVRLSGYRLDLHDEIAFDPTACGGFGANVNLDRTRRDGLLVETTVAPISSLTVSTAFHHVDSEVTGGGLTGRAIPLVPRNGAQLGATLSLPASLSLHVESQAVDRRAFAGDFDNTLGELPGYAVVNAAVGWSAGGFSLSARANNVLDHEYAEYGASAFDASFTEQAAYFPSPERNFRLSAGYHW